MTENVLFSVEYLLTIRIRKYSYGILFYFWPHRKHLGAVESVVACDFQTFEEITLDGHFVDETIFPNVYLETTVSIFM